ncbi:PfkB family carbohydrate kinase [Clostridium magnum]|uniref:Fructosamine kinase FrlD n=1 Tax=Clostridium magnum DSM 2767 TaxID=1121326 RepID=A0A161WQQ0_9CLOT|nr:PfkB family carbohydrate kinase [Clostridium magnum]KZL88998.1 fructosamine kinase FrlD [Clostridium magnum DSM 2767]SHI23405.1 Sugar or nucleoside kinase, ribokinase family [Clostridium magnum DSM 2767]
MIRAIGIGDNVCDKYEHLKKMFPGGQALNFAVYCCKEHNDAAYIGAFGSDGVAQHIIETLKEIGIDFSHSRHYLGENGYAVVNIRDGERVFVTSNKGGVLRLYPLEFTKEDINYIASFDVIHTSNNSYLDKELPKLASLDNRLSYDFSSSWKDEKRTCQICGYIDIGFISCSDITEEEIKIQLIKMHDWGCCIGIATRGSEGAILYDGNSFYGIKPKIVSAIDTLGAGDSFAAGFIMNFIEYTKYNAPPKGSKAYNELIQGSLENGARLSAQTCMVNGAFEHGTKLV